MANPDWDPQTFDKVELVPDIPPNQSFISVFDTAAELQASTAAPGAMAFALDTGSHGALYIFNGSDWKKIAFTA